MDKVATKLDWLTMPQAFERDELVQQLAETLTGRVSRSVLLVGPSGVGKTAIWHELVRRRSDFALSDRPFWATSGSRLVFGMTGFGMWQERCEKLRREAAAGAISISHRAGRVLADGDLVGRAVDCDSYDGGNGKHD